METQPIIIKRVKKKAHGHHGGAWKVAFADFAVAMMAFFLVMWLVNNTSQDQKKALAGYFEDPIAYAQTGGSNLIIDFGGSPDVIHAPTPRKQQIAKEQVANTVSSGDIEDLAAKIEQKKLEDLMEQIQKKIEEDENLSPYKDQVLLDITEEGLRVQIIDKENRPMFDSGSMELKIYSEEILRALSRTMSSVDNKVSISGHTDAHPFTDRLDYTNWELSAERANAARRALVDGYLPEDRIAQVIGLSSSALFDAEDPFSPANRRISIIVLNKKRQAEIQRHAGSTEKSVEEVVPPAEETAPEEQPAEDINQGEGDFSDFGFDESAAVEPPAESAPASTPTPAPTPETPPAAENVATQEAEEFGGFGDFGEEENVSAPSSAPSNASTNTAAEAEPVAPQAQPAPQTQPAPANDEEVLWDFE